jgi:arylsulfatase
MHRGLSLLILSVCLSGSVIAQTALPLPDFHFKGNVGRTIKESDPPQFPQPARPPKGAPNIVLVLIDDAGYGQFGTFGGLIPTPNLDTLATKGIRFTRFHTTALCSPTRAALITGRNHHSVNNGVITEMATGYDGYTGQIPRSSATVAQVLRDNGYATAWFGKNHNTPDWETSRNGPFDRWPSGYGFDYFYGFMGGDMDQWQPTLYEDHTLVPRSNDPDYILTRDLTDKAIAWLRRTRSIDETKPFFLYMAPGATHAPHHVSPEYVARFKGAFDMGWDEYRKRAFERQKQLGVVPADALLTPRPAELPAWESLTPDERRVAARMMEVFAGFTAQTDDEMGRLLAAVRELPDADNTMIIYIVGDNGASAEGGLQGLVNENSFFNGVPETLDMKLAALNELGGPKHFNHFPAGWAWAMNTPFQWTKQVASHLGGVRNPVVISWPKRITQRGSVRQHFSHVIDIAPTIYEATGIQAPETYNGIAQRPLEGTSMVYTFDDASAAERHRKQYFEMAVNRAMYADGWWAASRSVVPWMGNAPDIDPDTTKWELYHLDKDFTQAVDLAAREPKKLRELQDLWWTQAAKFNVLPLDGRRLVRLNGELQGRPSVTAGRTHFVYFPGTEAVPTGSAPNVVNKSYAITAYVRSSDKANGMVMSMGANDGGLGLYVKDGKPVFVYNFIGSKRTRITGARLPSGPATIKVEFTYAGGGMGKGGTFVMTVNGKRVGEATVTETMPITMGIGASLDVGLDTGSGVDDTYTPPYRYSGIIEKVEIDLGK